MTMALAIGVAIGVPAHAAVDDDQPITNERWVISELAESDSGDKYIEFYNNSTNDGLGWGDYFVNLPVDSKLLELMEVFGFQHIKQHAFRVVNLSDSWYSTLAFNLLKTYGLDANAFTEIADALEEEDGYSYQRCLYYQDGQPLMSNKFYYGKKTKGKEINCSDSSIRPTNLMERTGVCQGLRLNEIESYEENDEQFVELYNATLQPINLGNCYIAKSKDEGAKTYALDNIELASGELYTQPLNDSDAVELKLTEKSGEVALIDGDRRTLVDSVKYRVTSEDTSYALGADDEWHMTYNVTPDQPNVIEELKPCEEEGYERNPDTNRCVKSADDKESSDLSWLEELLDIKTSSSSTSGLTPCKEGYYRNPATNRCKKITNSSDSSTGASSSSSNSSNSSSSSALVPCKTGYYRNPATNRCKKIESTTSATSTSSLASCPTGYYRNSETNRCKKLTTTSTSSTLTPCKEGYERNPETNRCRKKTTTDSTSKLTPCKEGYERNPETNRCRKKTSDDGDAKYPIKTTDQKDGTTEEQERRSNLTLIIALAVGGALCLGIIIWQYRDSIKRRWDKLCGRNDNIVQIDDSPQPSANDNPLFKDSSPKGDDIKGDDPAPIEFK